MDTVNHANIMSEFNKRTSWKCTVLSLRVAQYGIFMQTIKYQSLDPTSFVFLITSEIGMHQSDSFSHDTDSLFDSVLAIDTKSVICTR